MLTVIFVERQSIRFECAQQDPSPFSTMIRSGTLVKTKTMPHCGARLRRIAARFVDSLLVNGCSRICPRHQVMLRDSSAVLADSFQAANGISSERKFMPGVYGGKLYS
jgi:hypothetical protein